MIAIVARDRGAAAAGLAFVAGNGDVLEIGAAGALQQVASGGREVAQLTRSSGQQRLRENRIAAANRPVGGEIAVAHPGSDADPTIRQ